MDAEIPRDGASTVASQQPAAPFLSLVLAELGLSPKAGAPFAGSGSAVISTSNYTLALILSHR